MTRSRSTCQAIAALCLPLLAAGVFRAAAPQAEAASAPTASIQAVYAAFTLNLTRFITWPDGTLGRAGTPFIIGTFPRDPVNRELDAAVRGEMVGDHPVKTIRLQSLDDIAKCQVVFFSRGTVNPAAVLARTQRRPILTVSDADGFLAGGGHVLFLAQPPHTKLEISAVNLRSSGLEARAQLLRIAASP